MSAAGLGTAALFGPPVRGGTSAGPKRLLVVFTSDGTIHERWRPTGSQTDFVLGEILSPFAPLQDRMIVLDGVKRITQGAGDGHEQGMTQILTGRENLSGETQSTGPSIDEFVNAHIGEGRSTLRLGVLTPGYTSNWTRMTFGESGNPLGVESDPYAARDDFFAGFVPDPDAGPTPEQLRLAAIRESVLGHTDARLAHLVGRASALDRGVLEPHIEAIASLRDMPEPTDPSPACTLERIDAWQNGIDPGNQDDYPTIARMQMELVSAAFACDRARVAVLQFSMSNSEIYHKWCDADAEHHGLSHYEFGYGDPFRTDALTRIYKWHAEQLAWLIGDLDALGVLDDTVVLWTSEMGEGVNHGNADIPMVLFGSGGGHFQTGRYMDYRNQSGAYIPGDTGISHCDVLTSICNAMGIETDGFGDAAYGPLPGVT